MNSGQPKYDINELASKWLSGTLTPEEKAYYEKWYAGFDDSTAQVGLPDADSPEEVSDRIYRKLARRLQGEHKPVFRMFTHRKTVAAAAVLLGLSAGTYFLVSHKKPAQQYASPIQLHDIAPGGNKAILTLANGKKIVLDSIQTGTIASQGATQIQKTGSGQLVYTAGKNTSSQFEEIQMNTLYIPRGGQYHITLSDGTQVWLNAATTLKYPSIFRGNERTVELSGEAYFEIAHNNKAPFRVLVPNKQTVTDIGTRFNINAYNDEPEITTTLIEGSVKVANSTTDKILKPGQQSVIGDDQQIRLIKNADLEETIAWKDNIFQFDNEKLESIMRKISRWYDVDIEYKDESVKELPFGGMITRFTNASKVLMMLELTNEVHFKIVEAHMPGSEKKIIVTK